ncbi:MAG TPA: ATP-binding protein [Caulobacteraceae bacterium]|nr:ATP-binding protein [Caulobacteraceae bacterium]
MLDVLAPASSHAVEEFDAVLVGFDVEGFSRTVEKATLRHGRVAGELAAQRILAGERIATGLAHEAGLRFADALGDGAVYLRAQAAPGGREARALQHFLEELKYAHLRETGLAVRAAWAHGAVRLLRPTAPILEHREVLLGPAVAKLHAGLSRRPRVRRPAPEPPADRPDLASREGEIADMTFVYVRLCRGEAWADLSLGRLDDVLGLIGHWAERCGGRLERITQDEKGVHLRVGLRGTSAADRDWRETLLEPQRALIGLGFDGAVAAAAGAVYRGPSEHGSTIVHGGAVNRAAKLCAAEPPGGLVVDASLAGASGRASPVLARVVGRREESGQAAAWLASGAPRLAILCGEAGIGKSHLLRAKLTSSEAAIRSFTAGAPARMLDPLGAWFDLLRQALADRAPGPADDAGWASDVLAKAGLDPAALALCARALRGVDAAGDARTASLSGGERATLTQRAMLALIAAIAHEAPWLLVMDDLQDVDEASLALTLALLDSGAPVRILAGVRTPLGDERLARLRGHLSTLEIPLPALTAGQVADLVRLSGAAGIDASEVMAISAGNPFRAVQATLALADDDGEGEGERTLTAILDRRLDRLDVDEREVLSALSIADRSWRVADIEAMAPSIAGGGVAEAILERLTYDKLIVADAGDARGVHAAHRLLAETVRRRMPAGVRRRLAEGAARRLAHRRDDGRRSPAVELASLWTDAGARGRAALLYERAARAAAVEGADGVCAEALQRALALFEEAPDRALPRRAVRWLAELSRAQWSLGLVDVANRNARRSLALAGRGPVTPRVSDSALAACAVRAETGQFLGDVKEILSASLAAGRFGAQSGEHVSAQGRALGSVGFALGLMRLEGAADAVLRRGERLASGSDPRPGAFALTARAILHFAFARWPEGEAALAAAREICAAWPQHHLMEIIETTCGIGAHLQGDGERALAHFDALGRRAGARGSALHAGWADYASAQTLLALDRPHEAWERLTAAEDRLRGMADRQSQHICLGLRARLAWRLGEVDEALAAAARCGASGRTLPPTNYSSTEGYAAPALVGALALAGGVAPPQRRLARALVREHMGALRRYAWVFPIARPRLALVSAATQAARRPDAARPRLAAAALSAEQMDLRFDAALARRIAADLAR